MIPFELDYIQAESVDEAVTAWHDVNAAGHVPRYFGGGTEFVTMAREHKIHADVLIDYKRIAETTRRDGGFYGAGVRLNEVVDDDVWSLLGRCCTGVADRTVRNSITLGGNIAGMLPYREAVLPFLLLDGSVHTAVAAAEGVEHRTVAMAERFVKRLLLDDGELVVGFEIDADLAHSIEASGAAIQDRGFGPVTAFATGPRGGWYYSRRTKEPRLDYPLVTLVLVLLDGAFRLATTGAFGYPMRATAAEEVLNDGDAARFAQIDERERLAIAGRALAAESTKYRKDIRGSREYRQEMTVRSLADGLRQLGEEVLR